MASRDAQIKVGVGFNVDKSGLNELKQSLKEIQNLTPNDLMKTGNYDNIKQARTALVTAKMEAAELEKILSRAFNKDLGTINVTKLNNELNKTDISLEEIYKDFSKLGVSGKNAFHSFATESMTANAELKKTETILDKIATTMKNTVKWGLSSSVFNGMTRSIQNAYYYSKDLDRSLNDIRIVTGASADEMDRFAVKANNAAKNLATSTTDYTEAALIYYQQGLADAEVASRAETTLKAANVTGQSAETVSELLTAVWNGYKVSANEAEGYVDKLAAVAATTASDLNELSIGMSKVASAANLMGVDVDQLNATLATVISVTRQAPESVGTAFKTIYARMSDIQAGLDTETSLDAYTKTVKEISGISVLDQNNQLRDMGEVIEEVGNKWSTMSREQQIALAQAMAGTRQYNNLLALYDNWDMYNDALKTSSTATGALQQQQDTYMESTAAHIQSMKASFEDMYDSIFNTEGFNVVYDLLGGLADRFANIVDAVGGGGNAILAFGSTITRVFSQQIAKQALPIITNFTNKAQNTQRALAEAELSQKFGFTGQEKGYEELVSRVQQRNKHAETMSPEQKEVINKQIEELAILEKKQAAWEANQEAATEYMNTVMGKNGSFKGFENEDNENSYEDVEGKGTGIKAQLEKQNELYDSGLETTAEANEKINSIIERRLDTKKEIQRLEKKILDTEKDSTIEEKVKTALIDGTKKKLEKQKDNLKAIDKEQENVNKKVEKYIQMLKDNSSKDEKGNSLVFDEETSAQIDNLIAKSNNINLTQEERIKAQEQLNDLIEEETLKLQKRNEEADEAGQERNNSQQPKIDNVKEDLGKTFKDLNLAEKVQGFAQLAGSIGQTISGMKSLVRLFTVWGDSSLSEGEKIEQFFEGLISTVSMLSFGISGIISAGSSLGITKTMILGLTTAEIEAATAGELMWAAITGPVGKVMLAIGAVVSAFALIGYLWDTPAEKLEKAKKASKDLSDSLEAVQKSAEELRTALEGYDSAVSKLESCVRGTQEWNEALGEVNSQVLDLLQKYPQLEVERNKSTGQLEILNGDEVQAQLDQGVANLKVANLRGQQEVREANIKVLKSDIDGHNQTEFLKEHATEYKNSTPEELDALYQKWLQGQGHLESEVEGSAIVLDSKTEAAMDKLAEAVEQNTIATQAASDVNAQQLLQDNQKVKDSQYEEQIFNITSKGLDSAIDAQKKALKDKGWGTDGISKATGVNDEVRKIWAEYAEVAGLQSANVIDTTGSDKNRVFVYEQDGEEKKVSLESMRIAVATAKANEELADSATKLASTFDTINKKGGEAANGIIAMLAGDTSLMTREDFANLIPGIEEQANKIAEDKSLRLDTGEDGTITTEELEAYLDSTIGDGLDGKISWKTAKQFDSSITDRNTFNKWLEQTANDINNGINPFDGIADKWLKETQDQVANLDTQKLTAAEEKVLGASLNKLNVRDLDTTALTKMYEKTAEEDKGKFVAALNDIPWNTESPALLSKALKDNGVETEYTIEELTSLIATMQLTKNGVSDLSAKFYDLHKTIDGLKDGDSIDSDKYNELDDAYKQFFQLQLDGTYKLIGQAKTLKEILKEDQVRALGQQQKDLVENNSNVEKFLDMDNALKNQDIDITAEATGKEEGALFDSDQVIRQKEYLSRYAAAAGDEELAKWLETINEVGDTENHITELAERSKKAYEDSAAIQERISENEVKSYELELQKATAAKDTADLKEMRASGIITDENAYNQTEFNMWQEQDTAGLDADELEEYSENLKELSKNTEIFGKELDAHEADIYAKTIMKMNKGVEELSKSFVDANNKGEGWYDILHTLSSENESVKKTSEEYNEAMDGTKDALANLLDTSKDYVSNDFIESHLDLIKKASTGSAEAIDQLKSELLETNFSDIIQENFDLGMFDAGQSIEDVQTLWQELKNNLEQNPIDFENPAAEGTQQFIDSMNAIIEATGMTVGQVQALMAGMGMEASFATEPVLTEGKVPVTSIHHRREYTGATDPNTGEPTEWYDYETSETTYEDVDGEYAAFALAVGPEGSAPSPKITGVTQKPGGAYNNRSSKNPGGSSGKSGGGKSGGSSKKADKMDKSEDEIDRYHDINLVIKRLTKDLEKLQEQQEKLTGKELIDNLNEQLEVIEKQKEAYEEKLQIERQEAAEVRQRLSQQGVQFDEDGYVSNYADALRAAEAKYNAVIDEYNKKSAEEQEKFKENVEAAKKEYEKFKKDMERYDTIISDEMPDLEKQIRDAYNQQIELQIQKFTMQIELSLDTAQAERDFNEFKKKVIDKIKDDDYAGLAESAFANLGTYQDAEGNGIIADLTKHVQDTAAELAIIQAGGESSVYGDNQAKAEEDLKKWNDELMKALEEQEDLINGIKEDYLSMIDKAVEGWQKQVDQYEYINELIEHDKNLIGLLYGDDAYNEMAKYYDKQKENNNKELDFLKERVAKLKENMDAATDDESREKWREAWQSALTDLNSKVEDTVQNLIDSYTNAIKGAMDELNKALTDNKGLDYTQNEWDLVGMNTDNYLDKINSMYAIQNLQNKFQDAIDATDSISAQNKLNAAMDEELEKLRARDKLTQTDIDRANLKYELALKQIALEEAQQNKSNMRLRRDSQGNYSYQFTADEDAINKAQQEVDQARNDLYNFDKDAYKNNLQTALELYQDYQEKIVEISSNTTLSEQEKTEQLALLNEQYQERMTQILDDNILLRENLQESAFEDLASLYKVDVSHFTDMTNAEKEAIMSDLVPQWDDGIQKMINKMTAEGGFAATMQDTWTKMNTLNEEYQDSLKEAQDAAGINFGLIKEGIDETVEANKQLLEDNDELITKYDEQLERIQKIITATQQLAAEYNKTQAAAEGAATAAWNQWQQQKEREQEEADKANGNYDEKTSKYGSSSPKKGDSSVGDDMTNKSPNSGGNGTYGSATWERGLSAKARIETGDWGTGLANRIKAGAKENYTKDEVTLAQDIINQTYSKENHGLGKSLADAKKLLGFKSGGYTGEWDSTGRLALLHQKELVLNEDDTKNILSAVNVVRNIEAVIDSLNNSITNRLGGLLALTAKADINGKNEQEIKQNVSIVAEFKDATTAKQIEEAIGNLLTVTSQKMYEDKR